MSTTKIGDQKLFGMIAMSLGLVTKEQLDECLELQRQFTVPLPLGAIMLARGVLTKEQLEGVLKVQVKAIRGKYRDKSKTQRRRLLGEILIEQGYINRDTLATALERQQALRSSGFNPRIGELLVYLGKITPKQLRSALMTQAQASA